MLPSGRYVYGMGSFTLGGISYEYLAPKLEGSRKACIHGSTGSGQGSGLLYR
jgi:hypothetical protein